MLPGVAGDSRGAPDGCGAIGAIVAAVYGAGAADPMGGESCEACASGVLTAVLPFV